jgi:hypothetical protein
MFLLKKYQAIFVACFSLIGLSLLGLTSPVFGIAYLPYGTSVPDANKDWSGDSYLCWGAAASNILTWGGWSTPTYSDEHLIFDNFEDHWTDQGGMMEYGWDWWLNGTLPPAWGGYSQVDVSGGGNHWPTLNFSDYFHETWSASQAMSAIDNYLHAGYGVTLAIYDGGHAITAWGYEYDDNDLDYYKGIYITDSDDKLSELRYYDLYKAGDRWYLDDYGGDDWYIEGVQALERNPIPEPTTICLMGFGIFGLLGTVIRQRRKGK